jgi:hypothetical protein
MARQRSFAAESILRRASPKFNNKHVPVNSGNFRTTDPDQIKRW